MSISNRLCHNYFKDKRDVDQWINHVRSDLMKDIYGKIQNIACIDSNVLIIGEHGSGKGCTARIIHEYSEYADRPFYNFFCSAIQDSTFQDAFQGKVVVENDQIKIQHKALEEADRGVLFLDRFTDLSVIDQLHVAEVIYHAQNRQTDNDGSSSGTRLIFSVEKNSFQQICHRDYWVYIMELLNPVSIVLPPLREHREDIPPLIDLFLSRFNQEGGTGENIRISLRALYKCISYQWPGNIRQLENAINNAAIQADKKCIRAEHLPFSVNWELWNESEVIGVEQLQSFQNAEKQLLKDVFSKSKSTSHQFETIEIGKDEIY